MNILTRLSNISIFRHKLLNSQISNYHLCFKNEFVFSKLKKVKPALKVPTISISKFNEELDGFLLYENKDELKIRAISIAFIVCFISGIWTYTKL